MTPAALTILNLAAMFTYRHTGGRYVTIFTFRPGKIAKRVIDYLNQIPPADPRHR